MLRSGFSLFGGTVVAFSSGGLKYLIIRRFCKRNLKIKNLSNFVCSLRLGSILRNLCQNPAKTSYDLVFANL